MRDFESLYQTGAEPDGDNVQEGDKRNQKQRRCEDHRLAGFGISALKPDIEDMKSEMHEAAIKMEERKMAVERQLRREFDDAGEHEGSDFAGAASHREDNAGHDSRRRSRQGASWRVRVA